MRIRDWQDGDEFDQLLDAQPDPLWVSQQHRFHGEPREGDRWRRTVVAVEDDGTIVGAGSLLFNDLHPDRYPTSIEVAPSHRRRGLGLELLAKLLTMRPDPSRPLESKVREQAFDIRAFWADARTYQRCVCPVVDPTDPAVRHWILGNAGAARSMTDGASHFAELYEWLHEDWSPVSSPEILHRVAEELATEADPEASSLGLVDGQPAAAAFAFSDPTGWDCVAETLSRDAVGGPQALRAALARTLSRLDQPVEFDGHDSDPHLAAILTELPWVSSDPLLLIEIG